MATVAQTDTDTSDANATTYTFTTGGGTALSIGADGGSDIIYIDYGSRTVANATQADTITVDGVSADPVVRHSWNETGNINSLAGIFSIARNDLPDPSQTDIDVSITMDAECLRIGVSVHVSPDASATASATATQDNGGGDLNVNTSDGDIIIGSIFQGNTGDVTWSGLTEQVDVEIEASGVYSSALASNVTGETPRSIDVTTSSTNLSASVVAVFSEAAAAVAYSTGRGLTASPFLQPRSLVN